MRNSLSAREEAETLFAEHAPKLKQKMSSIERILDCVIAPQVLYLTEDHPVQQAQLKQLVSCDLIEEESKVQSVRVKHKKPSKQDFTPKSINEKIKNAFGLAWT